MPDIYEIVNSTQLDSDLEDIADAIRAKSQGQDPLLFPSEFISEIGSIPTGASITGQTDVTVKALETIAEGDTLYIYRQYDRFLLNRAGAAASTAMTTFSPDGTKFAACGSSQTNIFSIANFPEVENVWSTLGGTKMIRWNPSGALMAVAPYSGSKVSIYDTTSYPGTLLFDITLPGAPGGLDWSKDGTRLAIAHATTPFISVYDTTTTPFSQIANPATLPTGNAYNCAWNPSGTMLAVTHTSNPRITIYDTTQTPYVKLPDIGSRPSSGSIYNCFWSPDGSVLGYTTTQGPYCRLYAVSGTTFAYNSNFLSEYPTTQAGQYYIGIWTSDGQRFILGYASSVFIYDASSVPYTLITKDLAPLGPAQISISKGDHFLARGGTAEPYFSFYNLDTIKYAQKAGNNVLDIIYGCYGYAKSSVLSGYTGDAAILFEP